MDERLRELITAVCQHPQGTLERQKAMQRLLIQLQHLPGLLKSSHPDYLDALNHTWEWVSRSLCSSFELRSPSLQTSLVKWVNGYLKWRIKDLYSAKATLALSLDTPIGDWEAGEPLVDKLSETGLNTPSLSGLEGHIERLQREKIQRLGLQLELYIQQDPEKKLCNCYPRAHPDCNCQMLSQRRYLQDPPDTFENIAQELNMKLQQLTNHWYGRCKPLLQAIATDLGYRRGQEKQ
jgi:hypothetical protein